MKPVVVYHTNDQQMLAARVHAHALKRRSASPERFDVRILRLEDTPYLLEQEGRQYFWWHDDAPLTWRRRDLQSFALIRRKVPAELGFSGRALVLDPDVSPVGDVYELLSRDLAGRAIGCTRRPERHNDHYLFGSAVMLLDCAKLRHWDWEHDIDEIFAGRLEAGAWLSLLDENADLIGLIEPEWNHLDTLDERTKLLHNTNTVTQPWKTGLRADFREHMPRGPAVLQWFRGSAVPHVFTRPNAVRYQPHPDPRQERQFFNALEQCLEDGVITTRELRQEMRKGYLRADALQQLARMT